MTLCSKTRSLPLSAVLLLITTSVYAVERHNSETQSYRLDSRTGALRPVGDTLVLTAPPRESEEVARATYEPIAKYLSTVIGRPVVYEYPRTFGLYRVLTVNGMYDLVFDGAHFIGYRIQQRGFNVLVKFPTENRAFVTFVKADSTVKTVKELKKQLVCAHPPPTIDTLFWANQFENDLEQQPLVVPMKGRPAIFKGLMHGDCVAAILPSTELKALDTNQATRVIFEAPPMPDQAISAGPRVTPEEQKKIIEALIAADSAKPTELLRKRFQGGEHFVRAANNEYLPWADLLRTQWGFYDMTIK